MLSALAIAVAGTSLVIVIITVYRNLPNEPVIVSHSDHGANGIEQKHISVSTNEVAICDHELNLVL